jgi:hypothetical protein
MATSDSSEKTAVETKRFPSIEKIELLGIAVLGLLAAYFIAISWRKWPDPIIDSGTQWYITWRLSQGARLYSEFMWNYGPWSVTLNAFIFRIFGPGMMVLVTVNLIIYGLIVALAYAAFRKAWGRLAAFVASAIFISVFSFSRLVDVGNYNYAAPYAHESTHGMLLLMVTLFIAVRWALGASKRYAFLLGFCGGLAAVIKPEFMLAGGVLGLMAVALRSAQRQKISLVELGLATLGVVLPTLIFAISFARFEPWKMALMHASQAWAIMFFGQHLEAMGIQGFFSGFENPYRNLMIQARAISGALMAIGAIGAAGWSVNRPWSVAMRWIVAAVALALACAVRIDHGWVEVGRCFPVLTVVVLIPLVMRVRKEIKAGGRLQYGTVMALALTISALVMLVRMALYPRVYHFGFYQAALAGMVIGAALIAELPLLAGAGLLGRRITAGVGILLVAIGCSSIAAQSRNNQLAQTEPIGSGRDQFFAYKDATTAEVTWALDQLKAIPPESKVLMLPSGAMVNYLSRHVSPQFDILADEAVYIKRLEQSPPDYVVLLPGDLPELNRAKFGLEGQPGYQTFEWLRAHYSIAAQTKRSFFLQKNSAPTGEIESR